MSQTALEMTNVVSAKTKGTKKLPLSGNEGKEGLAPRRWPALRGQGGSDLGSAWHLLSGEGWLALRESVGRRCRKSPTLEAAQNRQEEPSKLGGKGRQAPDIAKTRVCKGVLRG